jgi:hypothetical protein
MLLEVLEIPGPIEFGIHQPMTSASGEAAKHKYHLVIGKTGRRWLYADIPNAADHVYVDGGKGSQGMAGRTLRFDLVDGCTVDFIGPWKTGPDGLYKETGVDIRDKHLTRGIVALERECQSWPKPYIFRRIAHYDEVPVLGEFDRIDKIAQAVAERTGQKAWFCMVSGGGGVGSWADPKIGPPRPKARNA